jgi:hypothetical protein
MNAMAPRRLMTRPRTGQLEIHASYSAAGFRTWAVLLRDLLFGLRSLERHWTKREAVAAAERLSRTMLTPFERGHRQKPEACLRERTKFAAWQNRQRLVAARAAKRAAKRVRADDA